MQLGMLAHLSRSLRIHFLVVGLLVLPLVPLFIGATILTAFNDNAAITFLASQVPAFSPDELMAGQLLDPQAYISAVLQSEAEVLP